MNRYRFLDRTLASAVELPELPPACTAPDFTFTRSERPVRSCEPIHVWRDEAGEATLSYARLAGCDVLEFPDVGAFVVDGGRITAHTHADAATVRHCLLDQVLPRILARDGAVVLHAAAARIDAARIDAARIVLFVGGSGTGKSTLLAHATSTGAQLLSDDCVQLRRDGKAVRCSAPYPSLRVYPDSRAATGLLDAPSDTFVNGSEKRRVTGFPPVDAAGAAVETLFLLSGAAEELSLRPVSGSRALTALTAQLFTMDPTDLVSARRRFDALAAILRTGVRVFELRHPHDFDRLPRVWSLIRAGLDP